jgi:hypothetical protein
MPTIKAIMAIMKLMASKIDCVTSATSAEMCGVLVWAVHLVIWDEIGSAIVSMRFLVVELNGQWVACGVV